MNLLIQMKPWGTWLIFCLTMPPQTTKMGTLYLLVMVKHTSIWWTSKHCTQPNYTSSLFSQHIENFQPVLMKIYYYHASLKKLAMAAGYRGETLTSLSKCSNFDRTHNFLLQVWQAMYRQMLAIFCSCQGDEPLFHDLNAVLPPDWHQFVFEDCLYYLALFVAIRCRNWNLRISSLKLIAPLFEAFDRTTYRQLILNHLADIQSFLAKLWNVCKLETWEGKGHAVALDEAHEMCINKDMKSAVVHASKAYLPYPVLEVPYFIL